MLREGGVNFCLHSTLLFGKESSLDWVHFCALVIVARQNLVFVGFLKLLLLVMCFSTNGLLKFKI